MRRPRTTQGKTSDYLVLSRSCVDLYEEITEVFGDRSDIMMVMDRRHGIGGIAEIHSSKGRHARTRKEQVNPRMISVRMRKEAL